ncbi:c-type cytochrome [Sulfurimonas sp.]
MKKLLIGTFLLGSTLFAQTAQELINENGCLACHAIASKKAAPAFAGIARRNMRFDGSHAKVTIMDSIRDGSKGKYPMFSQTAMPAFSNLTYEQLDTLATYILAQSSKAQCKGRGRGMGKGMGR